MRRATNILAYQNIADHKFVYFAISLPIYLAMDIAFVAIAFF